MRFSVVLFVVAAALIVGAAVFYVRQEPAAELTGFGVDSPQLPAAPATSEISETTPAGAGEGPTTPEFRPEPKIGEVHPSLERFGVPIEAELPASANIRYQPQAAGSSLPDVPPPNAAGVRPQPSGSPGEAAGGVTGDEPSPFIIEDPGPAPESGDPGVTGPAPEDSDPGIAYPPPEASDTGIQYPSPEDSDPGIDYPAPEDSEPDPANQPPEA